MKKDIIKIFVGILILVLILASATYAWFSFKTTDSSIHGTVGCFEINYDKGQDIGSVDNPYSMRPTCNYNEGASAIVSIGLSQKCNLKARASINLNTNAFILNDGNTSGFSTGTKNVLGYQVVKLENGVETPISGCSGHINNSSTVSLCEVDVNSVELEKYKVYVYLDCNNVTTTYIGAVYTGYIQTVAYNNN